MVFTKKEQEASELKAYTTKVGKVGAIVASAATVALCSPAYAFASEGGGVEAILPKMNEFIPMLVAFIILWVILAKFGWPVFDRMLEKRANTIRDDLKNAEEPARKANVCSKSTSSSSPRLRLKLPVSFPMRRRPAKT